MSSRVKLLVAVAGLVAFGTMAHAADLAVPSAVAPVPYSWTGLYLGLNAGYSSTKLTETLETGATGLGSANLSGAIGGGQIGYNYQTGGLVLGFEADLDGSQTTKSITAGISTGTAQIPWVGTLRGRIGYAFDRFLLYATAGGGATQLRSTVNVGAISSSSTTFTHGGWTAGGGLEYAVTDSLSARLEYLYFDTGTVDVAQVGPPFVTVTGHIQDSLVRAGLNYRLPVAW
jgi:outer membrane immunogenic protein